MHVAKNRKVIVCSHIHIIKFCIAVPVGGGGGGGGGGSFTFKIAIADDGIK